MPKTQINRLAEMEVFAAAAESGGFSAAARSLDMTPSAVSKLIARLESRLGTRLFTRSTRKLQLTAEGAAFFERCRTILAEIAEAESCAGRGETPVGRVRVSVNVPVGIQILLPRVGGFLERYPGIELDISFTDRVVDLVDDRADVAIRSGPLGDSSLRARKLGATAMTIVGAPAYLARRGTPARPADLAGHARLGFSYARAVADWPLQEGGETVRYPINGRVQVSDGEALRRVALEGLGLVRIAHFQVRDDIAAGRLVPVLDAFAPDAREEIHALFVGEGGPIPARVRALLDHLAETIGADDL